MVPSSIFCWISGSPDRLTTSRSSWSMTIRFRARRRTVSRAWAARYMWDPETVRSDDPRATMTPHDISSFSSWSLNRKVLTWSVL